MKKSLTALFFIMLACGLLSEFAYPQMITLKITPAPPGQLNASQLWGITITNADSATYEGYIDGSVTNSIDGKVVTAKSNVFAIKPGTKTYTANNIPGGTHQILNDKYRGIETGNPPSGNYSLCIELKSKLRTLAKDCLEINVEEQPTLSQEMYLISPDDDAKIGIDVIVVWPAFFSWTPLTGKGVSYNIKIVEYKDAKPDMNSFINDRGFFSKENLKVATFTYPASGRKFEGGRKYLWSIQGLSNGKPIGGNNGWTMPYSFEISIDKELPEDTNTTIIYEPEEKETGSFLVELISPSEESQLKNNEFQFRATQNSRVESFNLKIFEINPEREGLIIDTSKTFFVATGLKEQTWKIPADAPLFDTAMIYAWKVDVIGNDMKLLGTSSISIFKATLMTIPCACYKSLITMNLTYCIGQPFPVINLSGIFSGGCTGSIVYSWSPSTPPTTIGPHTYTYSATKNGTTCNRTVILNTIAPATTLNVEICSPTGNTYTQCCGIKNFRIKSTGSTGCNAIGPSFFPTGTTYQWYIMRKIGLGAPPLPSGGEGPYPPGNPCVTLLAVGAPNTWYTFGGNNRNQNFPGSPACLMANGLLEQYHVTCKITFPGGSYNCMQSNFTSIFPFTVAPNTIVASSIITTAANCGNNGSINVSAAGGTGPYKFYLNVVPYNTYSLTASSSFSFTNLNATSTFYILGIKDATGCIRIYHVTLGFGNRPDVPTISTTPANSHIISSCSGSIILNANLTNPITGITYLYQWVKCTTCGACTNAASCNTTNCPLASYTDIAGEINSTLSTSQAGCYKVRVTDQNGACRLSNPWYVTSPVPAIPIITGSNSFCLGGSGTTLTATGTGLLWSNGLTTSTINVTTSGTYTVTSTVAGCTSAPASITVTGYPCNCPCNYTFTYVTSIPSPGLYRTTVQINNVSGCAGNINILTPSAGGAGTLTSPGSNYFCPTGISTIIFDFSSGLLTGQSGIFSLNFNGSQDGATNCKQNMNIIIP